MGWYHGQIAAGVNPYLDDVDTPNTAGASKQLDKIYHLCQESNWTAAVASGEPYFPPTFVEDGRFTRASQEKSSLVATANLYYKSTPGEWICLELDATKLLAMGLQILPQCAPEGTKDEPVNCLQIFGGISTTTSGVVTNIFPMVRLGDGSFYAIGGATCEIPKQHCAPCAAAQAITPRETQPKANSIKNEQPKATKPQSAKRRGLFGRKK